MHGLQQFIDRRAKVPFPIWATLFTTSVLTTFYFSPEDNEALSPQYVRSALAGASFSYAMTSLYTIFHLHCDLVANTSHAHATRMPTQLVAQGIKQTRLFQTGWLLFAITLITTAKHLFLNTLPTLFSTLGVLALTTLTANAYAIWHDKKIITHLQDSHPDLQNQLYRGPRR